LPSNLIGVGLYSAPEAERLIGVRARTLKRWLSGYEHGATSSPPLWQPALPLIGRFQELSFADMMEARFVRSFLQAGGSLLAIRAALARARDIWRFDRPFSTQRFRTDGRAIFLGGRAAADMQGVSASGTVQVHGPSIARLGTFCGGTRGRLGS
jgi:hypothetical protein